MQTWLYIPVLAACARTSNRFAGRFGEGIPRQFAVRDGCYVSGKLTPSGVSSAGSAIE